MAEESIGGRATAASLDALPRNVWRVLNDVPWPGRPHAAISHVVVGPAGVFVVDGKAWPGAVTVRDGVLHQDRHTRQGAVIQSADAAKAIARQLRNARCPVVPVLCLVRDEKIAVDCDGVMVCTTANIAELIRERPRVLADVQVERVAHDLAGRALPRSAAGRSRRSPSATGVIYLASALGALILALLLVARPAVAGEMVRDVTRWVADRIEDVS